MDINEIAKKMTRKEFLNCIDKEGWLILPKKFNIEYLNCPSIFNLKTISTGEEYNNVQICTKCWTEAVKDIKFKNDIEKENDINTKEKIFKETVKEVVDSKLYYGDEILKMIRENEIKEGQEFYIYYNDIKQIGVTAKWNGNNFISSDNIKLGISRFLCFQFQFIQKHYLDLEGAISISGSEGLKLKHKDWDSYISRKDIMDMIVYSIESKRMSVEDLIKPVWEVED